METTMTDAQFFTLPDSRDVFRALPTWITGHNAACVAGPNVGRAFRLPEHGRIPAPAPVREGAYRKKRHGITATRSSWLPEAEQSAAHVVTTTKQLLEWIRPFPAGEVIYLRTVEKIQAGNIAANVRSRQSSTMSRQGAPRRWRVQTCQHFIRVEVLA